MVLNVERISAADEELFAIACRIRQRVFLDEYGLKPQEDTEPLDFEPTTLHFLGFDTELDEFVAVARSVLVPGSTHVQLGRIAVLPEARGRRHGLTILQCVEKELLRWDMVAVTKLVLFSIPEKCAFYERCGFSASGHREVVRHLLLHEMVRYIEPSVAVSA